MNKTKCDRWSYEEELNDIDDAFDELCRSCDIKDRCDGEVYRQCKAAKLHVKMLVYLEKRNEGGLNG